MLSNDWKENLPLENITSIQAVAGGDSNQAYQVKTTDNTFFLLRQPQQPASFYRGEIAGLKAFEKADVSAPKVIGNGQIEGDAYLLLTFLQAGNGKQSDLGKFVARMHRNFSPNGKFGFDESSIGSDILFDNSWCDSWSELFIERRMDVLYRQLIKKKIWQKKEAETYRKVRQVMVDELNQHNSKPSLLHGDMWGGNHMFLTDGNPALFDPDALYGDREFDLGVSLVFNVFHSSFYQAYQKEYPLDTGSEKRLRFYSLYLLLVHVNKFGSIYNNSAKRMMEIILQND